MFFYFYFLNRGALVVVAKLQELQCFQTGEPLTCLVMAPGGLEAPDGVGVGGVASVAEDAHQNIYEIMIVETLLGVHENKS